MKIISVEETEITPNFNLVQMFTLYITHVLENEVHATEWSDEWTGYTVHNNHSKQ